MSKTLKLTLDILIGAVAPILILKYGTAPLGILPAYLTAALVPVVWVVLDLFVLTRRFNFISSYAGAGAILRGALAFWYVDGALFAFKDSASYLLAVIVFGGSVLIARPVTRAITFQGLAPETSRQSEALGRIMDEPIVVVALKKASWVIALTNLVAGIANYMINWKMVLAPFGTALFNDQVANVNAITRVVLVVPDLLALFWAFSLMYKAVYSLLPAHEDGGVDGANFWDLLEERERQLEAGRDEPPAGSLSETSRVLTQAQARAHALAQARGEFGLSGQEN